MNACIYDIRKNEKKKLCHQMDPNLWPKKKKKKGTNLIHEISWRNECVKLTPNTCSYEYNFFFYKKDHNLNILEKERKKKHKMGYCL